MKINFRRFFKQVKKLYEDHKPEIFTAISIVGSGAAVYLAAKNTPTALDKIQQYEKEHPKEDISIIKKAEITWKEWAPVGGLLLTSWGGSLGSLNASTRNSAVLLTLLQSAQASSADFKEAVKETVGEKKYNEIIDKVTPKKLEMAKPVIQTKHPEELMKGANDTVVFCESILGHKFVATRNQVNAAVVELREQMANGFYPHADLNDFYEALTNQGVIWLTDRNSSREAARKFGWSLNLHKFEIYMTRWSFDPQYDTDICFIEYYYEPTTDYTEY